MSAWFVTAKALSMKTRGISGGLYYFTKHEAKEVINPVDIAKFKAMCTEKVLIEVNGPDGKAQAPGEAKPLSYTNISKKTPPPKTIADLEAEKKKAAFDESDNEEEDDEEEQESDDENDDEEEEEKEEEETEEVDDSLVCDLCGKVCKTAFGLKAHRRSCAKKSAKGK